MLSHVGLCAKPGWPGWSAGRPVGRGACLVWLAQSTGDDGLGPDDQGAGDGDALALAAGEVGRAAAQVAGGEPHRLQRGQGAFAAVVQAAPARGVAQAGKQDRLDPRMRGLRERAGSWNT